MKCNLFQIDKTKDFSKTNKNYYVTFIIPLQSSHYVEEDNIWKIIFKQLNIIGVSVRYTLIVRTAYLMSPAM